MPDEATKRVEARIAGRKAADEIVSLLSWPDGHGADYCDTFCERIRELLPQHSVKELEPEKLQPIARLGATVIEYGEFKGSDFDNIPLERLDWYLRIAEENAKALKAYLTHPELQSRRGHA